MRGVGPARVRDTDCSGDLAAGQIESGADHHGMRFRLALAVEIEQAGLHLEQLVGLGPGVCACGAVDGPVQLTVAECLDEREFFG